MSSSSFNTRVVQVTNIAPSASKDQMKTLFSYIGKIDEIRLYPEDEMVPVSSKVCFVKFSESNSVGVGLHLTNTVFVDRALIVVPVQDGKIPDEHTAMQIAAPANAVAGVMPSTSSWPSNVVNQVTGVGGNQVIQTVDPRLMALGLPQYPPLPATMDPSKIEEIRRTIYVGNLDSTVSAEQLLNFFSQVGEIRYVRMAGDETQPTRFAFVEFSEQVSVATALTYNGVMFGGRPLKVNHSNNAIVKPQSKSQEAAAREIEEAMKKVKEAQSLITAAIDPSLGESPIPLPKEVLMGNAKRRSRSRSKGRRRSRSRSRGRRSRSRSKRSKSRARRSRSRERRRRRSRSRSRKRSRSPRRRRSKSRDRKRSRSRSRAKAPEATKRPKASEAPKRERRRRSKTPPRGYRSSRRSRTPIKRRSRSRSRRSRSRPIKVEKKRSRSHSKTPSPPQLERETSISPGRKPRSTSRSPVRKRRSLSRGSKPPADDPTPAEEAPPPPPAVEAAPSSPLPPPPPPPVAPPVRKSSTPPRKRSRSRSGSPHRSSKHKKDRKRRSRSRSHSRDRDRSKRRHKEKERDRERERERNRLRDRSRDKERERSKERDRSRERERDRVLDRPIKQEVLSDEEAASSSTKNVKVKRDYDEEEKGYDSSQDEKDIKPQIAALLPKSEDADLEQMDMDMDSD